MSINSHLDYLGSNLILNTAEKESIQTSLSNLSSKVSGYFSSVESKIVFGSFDRDVILPRKVDESSDVDYMIVFWDGSSITPQSCLNRLKSFVEEKYSRSEIFQSSPTIVLDLSHIKFELVPAYSAYGTLYIPAPASSYNDWIQTNPSNMKDLLIAKNTQNNSKIKPLVRIMKYWNVLNDKVFTSFELEKMIVSHYYFACTSIKDYFYDFVLSMNSNGLPEYKKVKVDRLLRNIREVKNDEMDYPALAEINLKKEFPEF